MLKQKTKKDFLWILFALCLAVCTVMVIVSIVRGTLYTLHSDDAIAVLLAREQLESGQLIPSGWAYAYEYWILSLNLLVLPFLKLTGQMLLSRELAVIVQLFCLEAVFYDFMRKIIRDRWAMLGCVLVIAPLSFLQMEHFYFQATYATTIIWSFVVLILTFRFFKSRDRKGNALWGVLLCALIVALGCGGTRTLGTVLLPMLGGLTLTALTDVKFSLVDLLKNRVFIVKMLVVCAASAGGYLAGNALLALGQTWGTQEMLICESTNFFDNFSAFITSFFQTYGCFEAKNLLTSSGITGVLKLLMAVICGIIIPVVLMVRFPKLTKGQKVYLVYSELSALVIGYMMVFCGLTNTYYFLPVYVNNVGLTCIFIDHFQDKIYRILMWGIFCLLVPVALMTSLFYAKYNYKSVERWAYFNTVDLGLLEFLESEGMEYGYSDFFDAQAYTVASNGAVEIVSVNEEYMWSEREGRMMAVVCQPSHARAWLSAERWYTEEYHPGECFVLTRTEFVDQLKPQYIERAERILTYNEYTILVYPKSLASYTWE